MQNGLRSGIVVRVRSRGGKGCELRGTCTGSSRENEPSIRVVNTNCQR
jgi:hypothetical protein